MFYLNKKNKTITDPRCRRHHPIRKHKQVESHQLENVLKQTDDLQSQHVLQGERDVNFFHLNILHLLNVIYNAYLNTIHLLMFF